MLHQVILAHFASSASLLQQESGSICSSSSSVSSCHGLPLRRAKFTGIPTESGGKWELCVLRKNNSPLRKKLSRGLCIFCQAPLGFVLNCLLS